MSKIIKLSQYAKELGLCYRTLQNRYHAGKIPNAFKDENGRIYVKVNNNKNINKNISIIYCRVSSYKQKEDLKRQKERLKNQAINNGYIIKDIITEVGSGLNDNRKKLINLLKRNDYGTLIVEHRDRLTRFGFNYIRIFLESKGIIIRVVNETFDYRKELIDDLVSVIYSFIAKLYGMRKLKNKKDILKCLEIKE